MKKKAFVKDFDVFSKMMRNTIYITPPPGIFDKSKFYL